MTAQPRVPEWVTRGKTIRQLIAELNSFEDPDREVRISLDAGQTHHGISLVSKEGPKYCLLQNAESCYAEEAQDARDGKEKHRGA